eukprot:4349098-Lingulodinium_polyedra.AAC.1
MLQTLSERARGRLEPSPAAVDFGSGPVFFPSLSHCPALPTLIRSAMKRAAAGSHLPFRASWWSW